jgi:hypothetical protein
MFLGYCEVYAQEYQLPEIEDIAMSFLNKNMQNTSTRSNAAATKKISTIEAINRNNSDYMYIVNTEDSAGWVLISNEKKYPTVIAHADSGSFVYDTEILPSALLCILEQHMDAIDSTRVNLGARTPSVSKVKSASSGNTEEYTSPVLLAKNRWKQVENNGASDADGNCDCNRVYNKFVPNSQEISCGRAYVGCGAIAMAQIMSYWQWPDYAFIKDTIIAGVCSGDWNQRFYDWDNIPKAISSQTTIYQADAVAGLLRDCAYAANTIFWGSNLFCDGCSSALIGNINSALQDVFGFHTKRLHEYAWTEMELILCQEIDVKRPVLCQAWKNTDTTELGGHTFVIDGYKTSYINEELATQFSINWGSGQTDVMYYSLDFNGYDGNRTFLAEIYPDCEQRQNDVWLSDVENIAADDNRTYYSTNDVVLCSNNNSIIVDSGGHLLVKAGNEVRLKSGFHAKAGSEVHILVDTLCNSQQSSPSPQYVAPKSSTPTDDRIVPVKEIITNNSLQNVASEFIISTAIYTVSGQLLQIVEGGHHNVSHLPNGMYILQHRMSDGSMRSEKVANYDN